MSPGIATQREQPSKLPVSDFLIRFGLPGFVIGSLMYALYWNVLLYMASDWWNHEAYSQGMLLPPLALYIAWLQKDTTLSHAAAWNWRGLLLSTAACVTYVVGNVASEYFLTRMSFVILLTGILWTFWGTARLKTLSLPLLLLATMVPLPSIVYNSLAAPLQLLFSDIGARLAQAFGVSIFRDGNILQLASTTLGVAEACSGLNSLSALLVGSVLLGYLFCSGIVSRIMLVLAACPTAIFANVIRVAGTAVLADYDEQFALGFYHSFSGWVVFVGGCAMLYVIARVLHAVIDGRSR